MGLCADYCIDVGYMELMMENYKINCVGISDEQKCLVQDAFFKLGYQFQTTSLGKYFDGEYYFAYSDGYIYRIQGEDIQYFENKNHQELAFNQLMKLANMEEYMGTVKFTKADLKTGMVVKVKGGSYNSDKYGKLLLVVGNSLQQATEYELLSLYLDDLTCTSHPEYDIVEVFEVVNAALPINRIQDWQLKSLWKRPELISAQQQAILDLEAKQQELIEAAKSIAEDIAKLKEI